MIEFKAYSLICVFAGLLRIGAGFIEYDSGVDALELLYMVIDLGFILGLIGFYLLNRAFLVGIGRLGVMISLCGFALIAGPEASIYGVGIYQVGSPIVGFGVLLLSIGIFRSNMRSYIAPTLLGSSFIVGLCSLALNIPVLFTVCGVLFGAGFIALGVSMWFAANKMPIE